MHLFNNKFETFLLISFASLLEVSQTFGCCDDVIDVQAASWVEQAPQQVRQVEEHGLHHNKQRNPLIVVDLLVVWRFARYGVIYRLYVRVGHPAGKVGVLLVVAREFAVHPAVQRVVEMLQRRHLSSHES